jgi:hypothetical protein
VVARVSSQCSKATKRSRPTVSIDLNEQNFGMNEQNPGQGPKRLWGRSVRFSDGGNNARPDPNA